MATDSSNVNGVYDQFQPAELAASTPSQSASASQSSNNASSSKADPQEIGWYFVEQYYTNLSKSPDKIHLFYNKKSQLIVGKEAEKVLPSVGTKAISEKIKSIEFSDCKIRVLNVDSQASYDNIVVQVIGEMSNKSEPHHKFVQTFVLATQPNGYFVLNDICRYLSEDVDEIVEDEPTQEEPVAEEKEEPIAEPEAVPEPVAVEEKTVTTEEAADAVDDKLEATIEEPEAETEEVNGKAEAEAEDHEEEEETATADTTTSDVVESEPAVSEAAPQEVEKPSTPEPTPAQSPPQQAPTDDGPPVKKTWASLVATTKQPTSPALPQAAAPTTASSTQSKPQRPTTTTSVAKQVPTEPAADTASDTPTSQQSNGWQEAGAGKKTKAQQSKTQEGIVHAYIKNVNDKIDARLLREALEKYGTLKYYDVSRPKQCAFVEFNDPASYTAAVADNPHTVGTEQINVEERRPRPGTTGTYSGQYATRGGASAGRGRGGTQQRSGSQSGAFPREAARGNFQQRGNSKTGTATRGRGQSQAA